MKNKIVPIVLLVAGLGLIGYHFLGNGGGSGNMDVKIYPAAFIMPSAYKVYENPEALEGRFYLFKSVLTNNGSSPIKNVKVSYKVGSYIDWTDVKEIPAILPGQKVVVTAYPRFKPDIVDKKTSSKETGEIKITAGGKERKENFSFEMKSVNDFVYSGIPADEQASYSDVFDNMALVPCYVTPNDPIVKYYTANIQEKVLKGETAGVTRDVKEAVRFLMGIYEATRRSGMVYSSTGGVPAKIGDVSSLVQNIRLPREVITGNTGLCIELSILYASILQNTGLDPIIYLIPGHAYPGFRMNGQYYALESTAIGGEGIGGTASAEQALDKGMKQLAEFMKAAQMGDERYKIIDINGLNKDGVQAMELKDDNFLRQKVDAMAAKFELGGAPRLNNTPGGAGGNYPGGGGEGGGGGTGGGSGMSAYNGAISFSYPNGWRRQNQPIPGINYYVTQIVSPDNNAGLSVYNMRGFSSVEEAFNQIQQDFYSLGWQVSYQIQGSSGNYVRVAGQTAGQQGVTYWTGVFKVTGNGVSGVAGGAMSQLYNRYSGAINNILSTVR